MRAFALVAAALATVAAPSIYVHATDTLTLDAAGVGMRLTTAKFFSPRGLPYSGVGVEPDVAVHATARPVDGQMPVASGDAALAAATDVARRAVPRPAARPSGRSTAAR